MKRTILIGTLMTALLAPFAMAQAHTDVAVSIGVPGFGISVGAPVYAPVPVYAPAPVYVPPPRVIVPAPVYVPPRVVVPAPVYYGRPGVWVAPRPYGYRHWEERRHEEWREHRRDHDGYRAGYGY